MKVEVESKIRIKVKGSGQECPLHTGGVDVYFRRVYFRGYGGFPEWHNFVDSDSGG